MSRAIRESELRERLRSGDETVVEATLRENFELGPQPGPLTACWCLRSDRTLEPDEFLEEPPETLWDRMRQGVIDLANEAQRFLKARQFESIRRENPHWPVVVAEGDSWVAHPLITDITDHLLVDERYPYAMLGLGEATDLLHEMVDSQEHRQAIAEHEAEALLISAGGNDLLEPFDEFLRPWTPGDDPRRLLDAAALDDTVRTLMKAMRQLLQNTRKHWRELPIVVHGYDHLRVGAKDEGIWLGPMFDAAKIDDLRERRALLRIIVDRYNELLQHEASCVDDVTYVNLCGLVPDGEWFDELHPDDTGFSRVSHRVGDALNRRLGTSR